MPAARIKVPPNAPSCTCCADEPSLANLTAERALPMARGFFSTLSQHTIPIVPWDASDRLIFHIILNAMGGLSSIASYVSHQPDLRSLYATSWHLVWSWIKAIIDEHTLRDRGLGMETNRALQSAINLVYEYSTDEVLRDLLRDTPGLLSGFIQIWVRQIEDKPCYGPRESEQATFPAASTAFVLFMYRATDIPVVTRELVRFSDGDMSRICSLAIQHLRMSLHLPQPQNLVGLHDSVRIISQLQTFPGFQDAFTTQSAVTLITEALVLASSLPLSRNPSVVDVVGWCIQDCCRFLAWNLLSISESMLRDCLEAGCLVGIMGSQKWTYGHDDIFEPKDHRLSLLEVVLPRYLVHRSVLAVVSRSIKKVESTSLEKLFKAGDPLLVAWRDFRTLADERNSVKQRMGDDGSYVCHHKPCGARGGRDDFLKCSACLRTAYCSKECQRRDWKEGGHKTRCKKLQSQDVRPSVLGLRDFKFVADVMTHDVRKNRRVLAEQKELLFPLVPWSSIAVHFDYTSGPVKITLSLHESLSRPGKGTFCDKLVARGHDDEGKPILALMLVPYGEGEVSSHAVFSSHLLKIDEDGDVEAVDSQKHCRCCHDVDAEHQ